MQNCFVCTCTNCTCTVPKEIDFPRYNMKCCGKNVILRGIFHVLSGFPLHFMLYRGNADCFSNSVHFIYLFLQNKKQEPNGGPIPFLLSRRGKVNISYQLKQSTTFNCLFLIFSCIFLDVANTRT